MADAVPATTETVVVDLDTVDWGELDAAPPAQRGGWGPDTDYILCAAMEHLDITPDIYVWAWHMRHAFDWNTALERGDAVAVLTALFEKWWRTAPLPERAAIVHAVERDGMLVQQTKEFVNWQAETLSRDFIIEKTGQDADSGLIALVCRVSGRVEKLRRLTKRERAEFVSRLHSLDNIWTNGRIPAWVDMVTRMRERFATTVAEVAGDWGRIIALSQDGLRGMEAYALRHHHMAEALDRVRCDLDGHQRAVNLAGRKILKRSIKAMDRIIGSGAARIFFSKDGLEFTGTRYRFKVTKKAHLSLVEASSTPGRSIPYDLALLTADGRHLAEGCLVFEGTPVLDQVTALFLNIKAGQEEQIVKTTNWFNCADLFYEYVPGMRKPRFAPGDQTICALFERGKKRKRPNKKRQRFKKLQAMRQDLAMIARVEIASYLRARWPEC